MGEFAIPNESEEYKPGQFFLHKIFGYRGVVLFPWQAELFERKPRDPNVSATEADSKKPLELVDKKPLTKRKDIVTTTKVNDTDKSFLDKYNVKKNINPTHVSVSKTNFYQVLVDSRDWPHVVSVI